MHVGVLVGEGNDGDVCDAVFPAGDGEADAVNGDGAFFGHVTAQIFGNAHGEPPVFAFGDKARDAADTVHVSLNEVAAEARGSCEGALEIGGIPGFFFGEGGAAESFAGEVGGK